MAAHEYVRDPTSIYIYIGRIPLAYRYLNEPSFLAPSRPCSAWIQMPSEECGQRIPSANLLFVERPFGEAKGVA